MTNSFICFENKGEVPINAFKLLGASNKRNDSSKIGFFGTGLKYAIAVLLREKIEFKVYSGLKEVKISTRQTKFLNEKIDVMTVNEEKTSITLDAGVDWDPWFAIREIYSNAIDEGGSMSLDKEPQGEKGATRIFVNTEHKALEEVFNDWKAFFSMNRNHRFKNINGKLLDKLPKFPEYIVFRKGIRAYKSREHSIFDYDLNTLDINESRVAKYSWQAQQNCSDILASADKESIKKFISVSNSHIRKSYVECEDSFWDYTSNYSFSDDWRVVLENYRLIPANFAGHYDLTETTLILPDKLLDRLKKRFGNSLNFAGDNKDKFEILPNIDKRPLQKILDVYENAGLDWQLEKIDVVDFNDKDLLGMAKDGRVLLSVRLFTPTHKHEIASTLLEEIVHAHTGYSDGTREMQNYLFNIITNMAKDIYEIKENKKELLDANNV